MTPRPCLPTTPVRGILLLLWLASTATAVNAQAPQIGQVRLAIGEPKEAAIREIQRLYRVDSVSSHDEWEVYDSTGAASGWYNRIGAIYFAAGATIFVERDWLIGPASATAVGSAVTAALGKLAGTAQCAVSARPSSDPGLMATIATVECGQHAIQIISIERSTQRSIVPVSVSETWRR